MDSLTTSLSRLACGVKSVIMELHVMHIYVAKEYDYFGQLPRRNANVAHAAPSHPRLKRGDGTLRAARMNRTKAATYRISMSMPN